MKYALRQPITATQWWPGEELADVTEVRHTQLGFIGELRVNSKISLIRPGDYVVNFLDNTTVMTEDDFKKSFKAV